MTPPGAPAIETERLLFRPFHSSDIDDLARLYADDEVRRYFPEGRLDRSQTWEELEWFIAGGDPEHPRLLLMAVIERNSGRFVGRGGHLPWLIDGRVEIEIAYLLDKAVWGRGYGTEIATALVLHGFDVLGLRRLVALIDPRNLASSRTAERAGLRLERELVLHGTPCLLYAIER